MGSGPSIFHCVGPTPRLGRALTRGLARLGGRRRPFRRRQLARRFHTAQVALRGVAPWARLYAVLLGFDAFGDDLDFRGLTVEFKFLIALEAALHERQRERSERAVRLLHLKRH